MKGPEKFNPRRLKLTRSHDFGKLYDYFAPRIYRHTLIRTSSSDEAKDITAKVFLKTWEYLRDRKKIKNIRAFLYKAADNLVIDWYRTRLPVVQLSSTIFGDEGQLDLKDPQDVEEAVANKFDIDLIKNVIPDLNPQDQAVIVMRFIDDMSIEEISDVLEKSKGAVAVSIHRALANLARACNKKYGEI